MEYLGRTLVLGSLSQERCWVAVQCVVLQDAVVPRGVFLVGAVVECAPRSLRMAVAHFRFYVEAYLFSITSIAALSHCLLSLSSNADSTLSVAFSHLR